MTYGVTGNNGAETLNEEQQNVLLALANAIPDSLKDNVRIRTINIVTPSFFVKYGSLTQGGRIDENSALCFTLTVAMERNGQATLEFQNYGYRVRPNPMRGVRKPTDPAKLVEKVKKYLSENEDFLLAQRQN